jgi:(2Fe-2S) ferredoxin
MPKFQRHVFICTNERDASDPRGCCSARGSAAVVEAFKKQLHDVGLKRIVRPNKAGCLDQCANGVTVVVYPEQVWYGHVTVADIPELVDKHLVNGEAVERLMLPDQPHLGTQRSFGKLDTTGLAKPEPKASEK